ncbi:hypothetical protein DAPPUDRAFT_301897 [Daphnia pulex]|uniref:Transmembrane protein 45B n=1 Tax=Daphnia pulex TaxID=6669 RepID=E9GBA4_DAPPU|nr:hypothetical protein DAPPUDRAFT_301897 [Daphnia pulex]|eukprot:EFX83394.1 hypothetical protein DAPPUDRAFT_301897 [Daphnia pulex]
MGTLLGHMLPGTFFILFAVWWLVSITRRYYRSRISRHGEEYRSSTMYLSSCLPRVPIEGILKIVATSIGIAGETATGFENGHWTHWGNAQHISMFLFFGFTGVVDVLYFYKVDLPPGLDYAAAFLAFSIEGFLFGNHLHGRSHMDVMVHMYLFYVITACVACVALEARYRENVTVALARTYFTFLQGTWFYQIGFILYPPGSMAQWDMEDHEQMMIVTMLFSWHCAIVAVTMFIIVLVVGKIVKRGTIADDFDRTDIQYQKVSMNGLKAGQSSRPIISNGSTLRQTFDETSEDEV